MSDPTTGNPDPVGEGDFKELKDLGGPNSPIKDLPIAPAHGIGAIALNMALKYHDIGTVQDGALYQQYKLEGRNMVPLHLDMVFDTAMRMEAHLIGASDRIAAMLIDAISVVVDEKEEPTTATPEAGTP